LATLHALQDMDGPSTDDVEEAAGHLATLQAIEEAA
jgi:hypothetical protein